MVAQRWEVFDVSFLEELCCLRCFQVVKTPSEKMPQPSRPFGLGEVALQAGAYDAAEKLLEEGGARHLETKRKNRSGWCQVPSHP